MEVKMTKTVEAGRWGGGAHFALNYEYYLNATGNLPAGRLFIDVSRDWSPRLCSDPHS